MWEGPRPYTSFVLCSFTICIWPYSHLGLWSNHHHRHHRHHWLCMNYMIAMLFFCSAVWAHVTSFCILPGFCAGLTPKIVNQNMQERTLPRDPNHFPLLAMSWRCIEWFSFFFQRKAFLGSRILHLTGYQRKGTTATGDPRLKCYGCN